MCACVLAKVLGYLTRALPGYFDLAVTKLVHAWGRWHRDGEGNRFVSAWSPRDLLMSWCHCDATWVGRGQEESKREQDIKLTTQPQVSTKQACSSTWVHWIIDKEFPRSWRHRILYTSLQMFEAVPDPAPKVGLELPSSFRIGTLMLWPPAHGSSCQTKTVAESLLRDFLGFQEQKTKMVPYLFI